VCGGILRHDTTKVPVAKTCPARLYRDRTYVTGSIRNINIICGQNARVLLEAGATDHGQLLGEWSSASVEGTGLDRP